MRGCFVTGTDTGVGKTVLTAALAAAALARGEDVIALKPILTGMAEGDAPGGWPRDDRVLAIACARTPGELVIDGFGAPVSPHLASELAGRVIDPGRIVDAIRTAGGGAETVLVEGVGGLLVPLRSDYAVRDLARELGLPVIIAARPGLGTINHTLLTLEAARSHGLDVRAVVLTPSREPGPSPEPVVGDADRPPRGPDSVASGDPDWLAGRGPDPDPDLGLDPDLDLDLRVEHSNRETIARLGGVGVWNLPPVHRPDSLHLARAGARLPLGRWLGPWGPIREISDRGSH